MIAQNMRTDSPQKLCRAEGLEKQQRLWRKFVKKNKSYSIKCSVCCSLPADVEEASDAVFLIKCTAKFYGFVEEHWITACLSVHLSYVLISLNLYVFIC